jgi:hypothetical protein
VSEEKFSKCGEGGNYKCKISGVRKKKKLREKSWEKNVLGKGKEDFSKFVFTSWVLCGKFAKLKLRKKEICKVFFGTVCALHTFGRHVVKHG